MTVLMSVIDFICRRGRQRLAIPGAIRLDVRRIENIKQGQDTIGARTRVRVVKNKLSPPFREAEFDLIFGEGISREGSILDVGVDQGIITRTGTWYSYGDIRLGQGKQAAKQYLADNPEIAKEVETKVKAKLQMGEDNVSESDSTQSESKKNKTGDPDGK